MKDQHQDIKVTSIPKLQKEILWLQTSKMDDSDCLKALVESKPRRLQEVLKNGGNATKYKDDDDDDVTTFFCNKI